MNKAQIAAQKRKQWAVVVAQLVEQSLPRFESSHRQIFPYNIRSPIFNCIEKTKIKKKELPIFNNASVNVT